MSNSRLQKVIASSGLFSRRRADNLIKEGRVTVNGITAVIGLKVNPREDKILVDGKKLPRILKDKVILLNKPPGIICSCKDTHNRQTVLSLLPKEVSSGVHPVGRLDSDSRGALLLTNNGDLTLKLTHPSFSHPKTYLTWVKGIPSREIINTWRKGIELEGKMTLKAGIDLIESRESKSLLRVELKEGRNRQIRKVAQLLGHPVIDLKRISISNIKLNNLQEGKWRILHTYEWIDIIK